MSRIAYVVVASSSSMLYDAPDNNIKFDPFRGSPLTLVQGVIQPPPNAVPFKLVFGCKRKEI